MVAIMNRALLATLLGLAGLLAEPGPALTATSPAGPPPKAAPAQPAQATVPAPKRLGGAESWVAYTSTEKAGQICYVVGQPNKSEPAGLKREVHLLVTHNKGDKTTNVVSFIAGYKFKDGSAAQLMIGDKKFDLFTKDDTAWARDAATDKAIVDAMLKGKQAVIKGTPIKGAATTDTYALVGFAQVITEIDKSCNIKR
jgi:Invasion associated locus B (IalB) protein